MTALIVCAFAPFYPPLFTPRAIFLVNPPPSQLFLLFFLSLLRPPCSLYVSYRSTFGKLKKINYFQLKISVLPRSFPDLFVASRESETDFAPGPGRPPCHRAKQATSTRSRILRTTRGTILLYSCVTGAKEKKEHPASPRSMVTSHDAPPQFYRCQLCRYNIPCAWLFYIPEAYRSIF